MNVRDKLPDWERLWLDLLQEEIRRKTRDGVSASADEKENFALVGKGKKAKDKKAQGKPESSQNGGKKKKDLSKIKYFHCHEFGHYAIMSKQEIQQACRSDALSSQFELDFSLIVCMAGSVRGSVWYMNPGASFCMTGNKVFFSRLEGKDMQFHIELGDDGRYMTKGVGTVAFKRESGSLLHLNNVMYVLGLNKNLVSGQAEWCQDQKRLQVGGGCMCSHKQVGRVSSRPRSWRALAQAHGTPTSWSTENTQADHH